MPYELPTLDSPVLSVRKRAYLYERSPTHKHQGIDIPAKEGTPVYAATGGDVVHAYNEYTPGFSGYGKVVVIRAGDGTHHLYAHLKRPLVNVGDRVEAGVPIGEVGRTGYTKLDHYALLKSGPHLHYEVSPVAYPRYPEDERVDPVAYLVDGEHVHPMTRVRFGGGSVPEAPVPSEGNSTAERPFVAPVAAGAYLRLSGVCPHCSQHFTCAAHVDLERGGDHD
jgi:murein DD-endopeptidase MepM/ murein hydrolase activator NlpD